MNILPTCDPENKPNPPEHADFWQYAQSLHEHSRARRRRPRRPRQTAATWAPIGLLVDEALRAAIIEEEAK